MKYFFTFLFISLFFVFFVTPVFTAPNINELTPGIATKAGYSADTNEYSLSMIVGRIINGVLGLVGTIFLVLTIYAGYLWMTAGGNEDQVSRASSIIKRSLVGIIIVIASYTISNFIVLKIIEAA